jgi:predicted phage-related endonuclease
MGITGATYCDVPVLIGGNDFRIYTVERDDLLIADLFYAGAEFWKRVQDGIAPDPQTVEDARRLWTAYLPGKRVIVDVTVAQACDEILALHKQADEIKDREAELKLKVMRAIGDSEEASYMGRKLATWKNDKPSEVTDWKGIVKAISPPHEVMDAFTETKLGARKLRIVKPKE